MLKPMSNVTAIIQCRMDSSRLGGKVLAEVAPDKTMLGFLLDRLQRCTTLDGIVVATTGNREDNPIAGYCKQRGTPIFRGHPTDVLDRYHGAATKYRAKTIVRVTGDCPFVCPEWVDELMRQFQAGEYDHAGLHNFPD
mgnify:CR=1 FL=1